MWFSPNERQASINRHTCSLADYGNKTVFSMVWKEWDSLPPNSFFPLLLMFCCLGLHLEILPALCLSPVLFIALPFVSILYASMQIPLFMEDALQGFSLWIIAKLGFGLQHFADFGNLARAHLFLTWSHKQLLCALLSHHPSSIICLKTAQGSQVLFDFPYFLSSFQCSFLPTLQTKYLLDHIVLFINYLCRL